MGIHSDYVITLRISDPEIQSHRNVARRIVDDPYRQLRIALGKDRDNLPGIVCRSPIDNYEFVEFVIELIRKILEHSGDESLLVETGDHDRDGDFPSGIHLGIRCS